MVVKVSKPEINVREKISELDKPSGVAGQAMLAAETPQEQFNLIGAGRRNMIINGAMNVSQRGTSQTSQNASGYMCDRFSQTLSSYGIYTREQSTDAPAGFSHSFKLTCTTPDNSPGASDYSRVAYYPEAQDLQLLSYGTGDAKDVTISFWVKSNVSATYVFWIYQYDNSPARHINKQFTIDAVDTWEYKTITIEGDTLGQINNDNGPGLIMAWVMSAGTDWTTGTHPETWTEAVNADRWVGQTANIGGAANNYFQITGVQLELGKVATPFEHRSYGEELAACQRYYQVGTFVGNGGTNLGDTNPTVSWMPQTAMRATASMGIRDDNAVVNRYTDVSAGSVSWVYGGISHRADNVSYTGSYANGIDQGLFVLDLGSTSSGVGSWIRFHWYADAEL